jgi:outer membrane protein assembly factor BamB
LTVLLLGILAACSGNKVNQPTELDPKFKDRIQVDRVWKRSIGAGDLELKLALSSLLHDGLIYSIDGEGFVTAVEPETGKIRWQKDFNEKVSGGLGGDNRHLYFNTFEGELVALDRVTANEVWRADLSSEAISKASSNGNVVAVQTVDGKLFTFGAADGRLRWRYDSIGPLLSLRGTASPIISQRYTITSFANGEMLAFDNQTGEIYWKAILATPVGRTELERLVDPDGQAVIDGETLYAITYQGKLVALDIITGNEKWSKAYSSFNSLAFGFGRLYVTTADGEVLAINPKNGVEIWRNEDFKYRRLSSPFVYQQTLVFSDLEGYLHVLNINSGEQLARKRPDSDGTMGEFFIAEDQLVVSTRSGYLLAYKLFSSEEYLRRSIDRKIAR